MSYRTTYQNMIESLTQRAQSAESARTAAESATKEAKTELATSVDAIIDGLGIRDSYPNITTTSTVKDYRYTNSGYYRYAPDVEWYDRKVSTTTFGRDRFLADVTAAKASRAGVEAAARIAAALKAVKEGTK